MREKSSENWNCIHDKMIWRWITEAEVEYQILVPRESGGRENKRWDNDEDERWLSLKLFVDE